MRVFVADATGAVGCRLVPQLIAAGHEVVATTRTEGLDKPARGWAGGRRVQVHGFFYGPGASDVMLETVRGRKMPIAGDGGGVWSWCHVDDAASAAVAALDHGHGEYNIVDDEPAAANEWLPHLARCAGAKRPMRVPAWFARPLAGQVAVAVMTEGRGFSNAKTKAALGWAPRHTSWRQGFEEELT